MSRNLSAVVVPYVTRNKLVDAFTTWHNRTFSKIYCCSLVRLKRKLCNYVLYLQMCEATLFRDNLVTFRSCLCKSCSLDFRCQWGACHVFEIRTSGVETHVFKQRAARETEVVSQRIVFLLNTHIWGQTRTLW
jgi:hypothetical protein